MRLTYTDELMELRHWRSAEGDEPSERLARVVAHLPRAIEEELTPRQRQILHLHFYDGLSVTQIAQQLNVHPSTVTRSLQRSARKLQHILLYTV